MADCYVCGNSADANPDLDRRSPRCVDCEPAADHVISMQTDRMVCQCGWTVEMPYTRSAARQEVCQAHWRARNIEFQLAALQ